jgi:hypothetical protein
MAKFIITISLFVLSAMEVVAVSPPPTQLSDPLAGASGPLWPKLAMALLGLFLTALIVLVPILIYKKYKK